MSDLPPKTRDTLVNLASLARQGFCGRVELDFGPDGIVRGRVTVDVDGDELATSALSQLASKGYRNS